MTSRLLQGCIGRVPARRASKKGFSLIEVVVAVGLCTFALSILAGLLPVGLGVVQNATQQIVETEIFNNIWSQANTDLFSQLGTSPAPAPFASELYFDLDGNQLTSKSGVPAGTVYYVSCKLVTNTNTVPPASGDYTAAGAAGIPDPGLVFAQVQIGFHVDPATDQVTPDSRVVTRNFLLVKRDGIPTT